MCVERSVQPQNNAGYDKPSYSILSHPNDSEHRIFLSVSIRCLYTVCCSSSLSHSFDTTYGRLSTPTFYLSSSITLLLLPAAHVVFTAEPPNRRTAQRDITVHSRYHSIMLVHNISRLFVEPSSTVAGSKYFASLYVQMLPVVRSCHRQSLVISNMDIVPFYGATEI